MSTVERPSLTDYQRGAIDALTEAAKTIGTDPASEDDKAVARWLMAQARAIAEQALDTTNTDHARITLNEK